MNTPLSLPITTRGADDLLQRASSLSDPILRFLGLEVAMLYYALVGPFVRRSARDDEFRYHVETGFGGVAFALGLVTAVEGIAAHLILGGARPVLAWLSSALSLYTLVWLAAAYHAARLRPVTVTPKDLVVRTSVLWTVPVPRDAIVAVGALSAAQAASLEKDTLRAALLAAPNLLLTLRGPVVARGLFGTTRSTTRLALYVDDPNRLRAALS